MVEEEGSFFPSPFGGGGAERTPGGPAEGMWGRRRGWDSSGDLFLGWNNWEQFVSGRGRGVAS